MFGTVPIIDCSQVTSLDEEPVQSLIFDAITSIGFVYLKNCQAFPYKYVDELFHNADKFWKLPLDSKIKYARPKNVRGKNSGYIASGIEKLQNASQKESSQIVELHESYNITPADSGNFIIPDEEVPQLRPVALKVLEHGRELVRQILKVFGNGLKLENPDFFVNAHSSMWEIETVKNVNLRLLNYPPVPEDCPVEATRCGDHSDYGSVTLLLQDDIGGLEVLRKDGQWVKAEPVKNRNAILLNTGDLMQFWTSDRIQAARHRVLVPPIDCQTLRANSRRSIAYFVLPNIDWLVEPIDGSKKYPPVKAMEYLMKMFEKTI